ncbi:DNA cytosine methyltransferase [Acinetobacter faecalis]|uniref:DNA cytosine methyltransferase n=1 Tax=Acinetobacter faecalis TaxID=2665161 RepID=UPI002A91CF16|nr:DNA cytosine methyltransferase [Acinetobacter faecalis]MDY6536547.1 DNA cytosine methyltransferase [Acinetobacter faecalis]
MSRFFAILHDMSKFTYIDLFAGCGGLSEGFTQSGLFEGLAHVEWELPMVQTLRHRLEQKWNYDHESAEKSVVHFDIQKSEELIFGGWSEESEQQFGSTNNASVKQRGLRGLVGDQSVDVVVGGPPCQAYSIAGRAQDKNGMKDDYRNYLFESFVKVVDEFKPKLFVFENVPGILTAKPGDKLVIERIYEAFEAIGYTIKSPDALKKAQASYTATEFGVPQKRNRIIIVGVRQDLNIELDTVYEAINQQKTTVIKTVADAIGDLPKFMPLQESRKENGKNISHEGDIEAVDQHQPRFHNIGDIQVFSQWVKCGMNKLPNEQKIEFYNQLKGKKSNHAKYRNLEWDQPSPTIVAHLYKDGLMFIHPDAEQARSITIREAGLLQSFPVDYQFLGSMGYCYKMIGNAVPPLMAEKIALGIADVLGTVSEPKVDGNSKKISNQAIVKTKEILLHNMKPNQSNRDESMLESSSSTTNDLKHTALELNVPQEIKTEKHVAVKKLNILVACEESQAITKELRDLGHNAFSCDLLPCSGGHPEWHFNIDVFEIIKHKGGELQNGESAHVPRWDMMIAHPPCTYLAVSGAQWYYHPEDKHLPKEERRPHPKFPNRAQDRDDAIAFFKALWEADIPKIAIENPVGVISSHIGKATQIVQPYMFGDEATKTTCLWIKGLPLLEQTNLVGKGERVTFASGKSMPKWYAEALVKAKTPEERRNLRSKTFKGMAKAMALQWAGKVHKD